MSLLIQPAGAQILHANFVGDPSSLLYLSPIALDKLPRRGGVPILFPQFADRGPLPKHGFARNMTWQCARSSQGGPVFQGHYQLQILPHHVKEWPHSAMLDLHYVLTATEFSLNLKIQNCGENTFLWTGGLHPYWHVADLLQSRIVGLQNTFYNDRHIAGSHLDKNAELTLSENAFERLYLGAPVLELLTKEKRIRLECEGFTEWMIWNPGAEGSHNFIDLLKTDWRRFVCIEPVIANASNELKPGEMFEGALRTTLLA
jgi:glucose-6-phosphate 1-epimerase